jgi:tyrosine-protein phosphatase YwqE
MYLDAKNDYLESTKFVLKYLEDYLIILYFNDFQQVNENPSEKIFSTSQKIFGIFNNSNKIYQKIIDDLTIRIKIEFDYLNMKFCFGISIRYKNTDFNLLQDYDRLNKTDFNLVLSEVVIDWYDSEAYSYINLIKNVSSLKTHTELEKEFESKRKMINKIVNQNKRLYLSEKKSGIDFDKLSE